MSGPETHMWMLPWGATFLTAMVVLAVGAMLTRIVPALDKVNIPTAVTGGLIFAAVSALTLRLGHIQIDFDMALRTPIMLAFFATIGLNASFSLLKRGGTATALFLLLAAIFLVGQNILGVLASIGLDLPPVYGLIVGSATLSGGHGTALAWAETLGPYYPGLDLEAVAILAATFGLISGGLIGGPLATRIIRQYSLRPNTKPSDSITINQDIDRAGDNAINRNIDQAGETIDQASNDAINAPLLRGRDTLPVIFMVGLCIAAAMVIPALIGPTSVTVPSFIWAIFAGIILRNICEWSGLYAVPSAAIALVGDGALSLFIAMAMMSISLAGLWQLALPLTGILVLQVGLMALFARFVTWPRMGGGYDAAVIAGGHCGFGLGATPTAMANIQAITARYGASMQACLVVPIVGAFFIDIVNALVIEAFLALPILGS